MNCSFVRSRMSCYIDGELSGDEMIAIRRHIDACADCRRQHESDRAIKHAVATLPEREASPDLEARLLAAVRNAGSAPGPASTMWPTGRMALALAAAAVIMFCVFMLRGSESPEGPIQGNDFALDQDWNNARSVFPASNLPAGLDAP